MKPLFIHKFLVIALSLGVLTACQTMPQDNSSTPDQQVAQLIRLGDRTLEANDVLNAKNFYQRALSLEPLNREAMNKLAGTLERLNERRALEQLYGNAVSRKPDDANLLRLYGNALVGTDKIPQAIIQFDKALKLDPLNAKAHNSLGVAFDLTGKHDQAQESYQKALAITPGEPEFINNLALSRALSGDYESAVEILSPFAFDPQASKRMRLNLALIYGLMGNDDMASKVAGQILDRESLEHNLKVYEALRRASEKDRKNALMPPAQS